MTLKLKKKFFLGYIWSGFIASQGFAQGQNREPLSFPSSISLEKLTSTVGQCREVVNEIWQKRLKVPQNHMRDFDIAIGDALEKCEALKKIYDQVLTAPPLEKEYDQALEAARNFAGGVSPLTPP